MRPQFVDGDPIATLRNCGGYYMRPQDANGNWCGPLVGYAKRYGPQNKQMVGNLYLDCARLERYPWVLAEYAKLLAHDITESVGRVDWVMGIPEGGKTLGAYIALRLGCEYIYPEKDKSGQGMVAKRHKIEPNTRGLIAEDVCNNFYRTKEVMELIEDAGAEPVGVVCIFNRSGRQVYVYNSRPLPVLSVKEVAAEQFEQEDPAVANDVFEENVRWEPKACIEELVTIMRNAGERLNRHETGS